MYFDSDAINSWYAPKPSVSRAEEVNLAEIEVRFYEGRAWQANASQLSGSAYIAHCVHMYMLQPQCNPFAHNFLCKQQSGGCTDTKAERLWNFGIFTIDIVRLW